jgi:hypothetical protein
MKVQVIKIIVTIFVCIGLTEEGLGQNTTSYRIVSSNLGASGSSQTIETNNGVYKISQSIGQASVIGTHYSNGYFLRQGYQQPLTEVAIKTTVDFELIAKIHPNPFRHQVTITFNTDIKDDISILLVDMNGKVIRNQLFQPTQKIDLLLADISIGSYVIRVLSAGKA